MSIFFLYTLNIKRDWQQKRLRLKDIPKDISLYDIYNAFIKRYTPPKRDILYIRGLNIHTDNIEAYKEII